MLQVEVLMESYAKAKKAVEDKNRELNSCSEEIKQLELQREQYIKVWGIGLSYPLRF